MFRQIGIGINYQVRSYAGTANNVARCRVNHGLMVEVQEQVKSGIIIEAISTVPYLNYIIIIVQSRIFNSDVTWVHM